MNFLNTQKKKSLILYTSCGWAPTERLCYSRSAKLNKSYYVKKYEMMYQVIRLVQQNHPNYYRGSFLHSFSFGHETYVFELKTKKKITKSKIQTTTEDN